MATAKGLRITVVITAAVATARGKHQSAGRKQEQGENRRKTS